MSSAYDALIVGAGIAGMEAGLLLANSGRKVCLVEKLPLIGGNIIKNEESFPHLECSTCMVAPVQQAVLQNSDIDVITLGSVEKVEGEAGNFNVTIHKQPRYVSLEACIGCGMCYEPCPVSLKNEWEEKLSDKKAIYVPCAGALPNVPVIDPRYCLNLNGKKSCQACQEACMFGAIDFSGKAEDVVIQTGSIIVATGFEIIDVSQFSNLGYGKFPGVYTSMEFERLFASNGPTSGELTLRGGESPKSVAIVHCVGRKGLHYCSGVCCLSSLKHAHFVKHKLPETKVYEFHSDLCVPGKTSQKFFKKVKEENVNFIYLSEPADLKVTGNGTGLTISYKKNDDIDEELSVDMIILAVAIVPDQSTPHLAKVMGIELDDHGFIKVSSPSMGSVKTSREGIYVAGCAEGPKDAQSAVVQAESVVGSVINSHLPSETAQGNIQE